MPGYVTRTASGKLASYHGTTLIAMHVDTDGKATIEAATLANGTIDITTLDELTTYELARTTFTAEADETLGKIDVAADENPYTDTDGETVAGIVIATQAGGSDSARTVLACHTFTPRPGSTTDDIVFANEKGFASWEPAPGDLVRGIGSVRPDTEGIIDPDELSALLSIEAGEGGGAPVFAYAERDSELDLSASTDGWVVAVVAASSGVEADRPHVRIPHPTDEASTTFRVSFVPAVADPANGSLANYGATIYYRENTPGVLGDLTSLTPADLGAGETFEVTIGGSAYSCTLTGDYTGDLPSLIGDLYAGWLADGAPIAIPDTVSDQLGYYSPVTQEWFGAVIVTTTTGDSATIEITEAGTGDPIGLAGLTTIDGETDWAIGINLTQEGTGQENVGGTHTWQDRTSVRFMQRLDLVRDNVSPFPQWAALSTRVDAPFLPYGPVTPSDWTEGAPAYVGNALDILAARAGGGGGGSVATDSLWDASGDLAVGSGANTAAKLTKGTSGTFLKAGASTLSWESVTKTDVGLANVTNDAQLKAASNLSDLASAPTARNNLGVSGTLGHRDGTTALTGTTTPTSLLASTVTVPAIPVGSTLNVEVIGRYLNNTGANRQATVGVKFDSTTLVEMIPTGTGAIGSAAGDRTWRCMFTIALRGNNDVDAWGTSTAIGTTAAPNIVPPTTTTPALQSGGTLDVIGTHLAATAAEIQVTACVVTLTTPRS